MVHLVLVLQDSKASLDLMDVRGMNGGTTGGNKAADEVELVAVVKTIWCNN